MPARIEDLKNKRFGRIYVIDRAEDYIYFRKSGPRKGKIEKRVCWKCKCDCGKIFVSKAHCIKESKSCGCIKEEMFWNEKKSNIQEHIQYHRFLRKSDIKKYLEKNQLVG